MNTTQIREWIRSTSFHEVMMLVLTGALVYMAVLQTKIYSKQLDAMRKDQRAWIAVFSPTGMQFNLATPTAEYGTIYEGIAIVNTGKTPAKHYESQFVSEIIRNGAAPTFSYEPPVAVVRGDGNLLNPNSPAPVAVNVANLENGNIVARHITPGDHQQIMEGKDVVVLYGRVAFTDVYDKPHWLHFCGVTYIPTSPVPIVSPRCVAYNDIDNDSGYDPEPNLADAQNPSRH